MHVHSIETTFLVLVSFSEIFIAGYLQSFTWSQILLKIVQMEDHILNLVVLGVISWSTTFVLARKIFPKRSFEFCNRIVSMIHATLAVILASLSVQDWRCPVCPLASKSSTKQVYLTSYIVILFFQFYGVVFFEISLTCSL